MLRLRFLRVGKKNAPTFRLVVAPRRSPPRGGQFKEILGFYNPRTKERGVKKDRILYWISQGAQPSDTAHNFLVKEGVIQGAKIAVHAKSKKTDGEKSAVSAKTTPAQEARVQAETKKEDEGESEEQKQDSGPTA